MKYIEAPDNLLIERLDQLVFETRTAAKAAVDEVGNETLRRILREIPHFPGHVSDELEGWWFVFHHNLTALVWDSLIDYECDCENLERLDVLCSEIVQITEILLKRNPKEGLQLRWFTCSECGHEMQLYTYSEIEDTRLSTGNEKDSRSNAKCVYEFMHKSHLCTYCWNKFIVEGK